MFRSFNFVHLLYIIGGLFIISAIILGCFTLQDAKQHQAACEAQGGAWVTVSTPVYSAHCELVK